MTEVKTKKTSHIEPGKIKESAAGLLSTGIWIIISFAAAKQHAPPRRGFKKASLIFIFAFVCFFTKYKPIASITGYATQVASGAP